MTNYRNLIIEPLNNTHNRPGFQCGKPALDHYLKKQAKQDSKRRISRIFVAILPESPTTVVGYYTLSALSIELHHLPANVARKLARHPIPTALIGRLAVSQRAQGFGIGKMLLMDAVKRIFGVSNEIAVYALVVDALDEQVESFYRQFGFSSLSVENKRLFLPLKAF